ncbi:MAG: PAS domain-containing protein [Caldilineaceae bacterium]|nr:PAS domain-containing protein [Caldilineaceae bacterium]
MSANVPTLFAAYQLRQLEFLLRISRAMTSRLELPSLLELILRSAAEMVGAPAGMILLQSEHTLLEPALASRFQVRALYAIPTEALAAFEPLLDAAAVRHVQDAVAAVAGSNQPPTIDLSGRVHQVETELGMTLGQVVALPLLFEDDFLGLIYLFRGDYAFSQLDWQFLQGFADQAAVAVRNARLYSLLRAESSRLITILENSADGIMILTRDRIVVAINHTLASMAGIALEDAVGRPCSAVLPLENVTGTDFCRDESYTGQFSTDNLRCEGELVRPGDKHLALAVTFTPLYAENGRLINIIVNVHDITRFREEEEMKSTFTSIISHELKTPVALIKGYAQTLARPDAEWDGETARAGLQIIEEEADRLESLINNLLDASRIQAKGLRLDFADVDLVNLLSRMAEVYRTQANLHRIRVAFDNPLPPVWGDEERLRQVFTNLLNNAIKYSPQGGAIAIGGWFRQAQRAASAPAPDAPASDAPTSDAPASDAPAPQAVVKNSVVIYISDQGIGIPASDLPKVFDRYYRVDSSLRRSTAGAGLGLYLSKVIVDAHGGRIWATSEQGKGTTFFVALPVDPETL